MSMLVHGARLGFSDPKTIGSAGAYRQRADGSLNGDPTGTGNQPPGGIQEFAPTTMAAVPKIWDILKKGVEEKVSKGSAVGRAVFQAAFSARSRALQQGRESPLLGLLFKKKVGAVLGGRVKLAVTGGGPIAADVQNFIRVAMHFNLVQGYGLTETCSAGTLQPPDSTWDGVAGSPVACLQMRLADCGQKEADGSYTFLDRDKKPYLSTDCRHGAEPCLGRGEVRIKGANLASGYYCEAAMTKKEFDSEGWFRTGDVGIWTPIGTLKIVDRLKNLVKLKGGEYIAIEFMEATYAGSVFVDGKNGGLLCYGDGSMDKPVALVQVNGPELKSWARANGVAFASLEDLCVNPAACAAVLADLNAHGKGKLGLNEALAAVSLLPGTGNVDSVGPNAPWTSDNGYLTAANKLARNTVLEGFRTNIDAVKPLAIR
jgi:long-chain acyl-CoA synthetase